MKTIIRAAVCALALVGATAAHAAATPLGPSFVVNTPGTGDNDFFDSPQVAMAPTGEFVVIWHQGGTYSQGSKVYGRRFSASGVPLGDQFLVSRNNWHRTGDPIVARNPAGGFIVAWVEIVVQ